MASARSESGPQPGTSSSSSKSNVPEGGSFGSSIGLNLRVTGYCNQGGRKYMEDVFSVAYQQTPDEKDLEYAFFGIFDGHGGREAAVFAKEHLMDTIVKQKGFWSVDDDQAVLRAIHEGFVQTHQAMWKELDKWPKTMSGLPSTAGTTASVAFIRRGKIYVGHVGDSAIVLGSQSDKNDPAGPWLGRPLTRDHKPESVEESTRITNAGGKVVSKSGVPRVVWNRPKMGHKGPVRRSTPIDEIPFLAVARSLGDLWSYNSKENVFVVSPEPDTYVYPVDIATQRCLILGTDGAWNMLSPQQAVSFVCQAEKSNEANMLNPTQGSQWINPSKYLVDCAIERWTGNNLRADNTSVVTVMLDPPGPPRAQVLKKQRSQQLAAAAAQQQQQQQQQQHPSSTTPELGPSSSKGSRGGGACTPPPALPPKPSSSLQEQRPSSRQHPSSDDIQVNEISSTEPSAVDPSRTTPRRQSSKRVLKESRLSRELSALRLNTPNLDRPRRGRGGEGTEPMVTTPPVTPRRNTRRSCNTATNSLSDTENEEFQPNRPTAGAAAVAPADPVSSRTRSADMEVTFKRINHRINSMEKRLVRKTSQITQEMKNVQAKLQSKAKLANAVKEQPTDQNEQPATSRSLRPRSAMLTPQAKPPPPPAKESSVGRKRKLEQLPFDKSGAPPVGGKSPRHSSGSSPRQQHQQQLVQGASVATRSRVARKARVATLKK